MPDVLIKNEMGTSPVATGHTLDPINAVEITINNIDPVSRIEKGSAYMVGLDNGTQMQGRVCVALAGTTGNFRKG